MSLGRRNFIVAETQAGIGARSNMHRESKYNVSNSTIESRMEQIQTSFVDAIEGTASTEDGKHVLLKIRSGDQQNILAFTVEESFQLIASLIQGAGLCQKIQPIDRSKKLVMNVEAFECALADDGHVILLFHLAGGMEMAFQVRPSHVSQMREALQSAEGTASTERPLEN